MSDENINQIRLKGKVETVSIIKEGEGNGHKWTLYGVELSGVPNAGRKKEEAGPAQFSTFEHGITEGSVIGVRCKIYGQEKTYNREGVSVPYIRNTVSAIGKVKVFEDAPAIKEDDPKDIGGEEEEEDAAW